ncbi:MAG: glycoside hydrolase family 127 protein [Bacteroidaceae bacterium]|nr:glycoside hydrolase family 127 protein [Bacteroidaceae bacterium]
MKKAVFLLLFMLLCGTMATSAQKPLKKALTYVDADSVFYMSKDFTNFRIFPFFVDKDAEFRRPQADKKHFKARQKRWCEKILPTVNIAGGAGDEVGEAQAFGAASGVFEAADLFLHTADAHYMNIVERALYNAVPETFFGLSTVIDRRVAATAMLVASCCMYATDKQGIYVNLYSNSYAHIATKDFDVRIDQITNMPYLPQVKFRFAGLDAKGQTLTMRFRIPEWVSTELPLYVNGHDTPYETVNGYAVVKRIWKTNDEVYFILPTDPCFEQHGDSLIMRTGPMLYAFDTLPADAVPEEIIQSKEDEQSQMFFYDVRFSTADEKKVYTAKPYLLSTDTKRKLWIRKKQ